MTGMPTTGSRRRRHRTDRVLRRRLALRSPRLGQSVWLLVAMTAAVLSAVALVRGPLQMPFSALWGSAAADGYRYTRSQGAVLLGGNGRYQVLIPFQRQIWIGSDGSGRLFEVRSDPVFFGTRDAREWQGQVGSERIDEVYGSQTLTYLDLDEVPRESTALRAFLVARADRGASLAGEIFAQVRGYLLETAPPSDVALALKAILVDEPGIEADPRGEGSIAVSVTMGSPGELRLTLILGVDGTLLREERTLLASVPSIDASPPVSLGYTDFLEAGVVERLPPLP